MKSMETILNNRLNLVENYLAVGGRACAEDRATLLRHDIGAILSLTGVAPGLNLPNLLVELQDRQPLPGPSIQECVEFIDNHRRSGRRVLVHCEMGISRSPAICIAFLHGCRGLSLDEAHHRVKTRHPMADPHPLLLSSLRDFFRRAPQGATQQNASLPGGGL